MDWHGETFHPGYRQLVAAISTLIGFPTARNVNLESLTTCSQLQQSENDAVFSEPLAYAPVLASLENTHVSYDASAPRSGALASYLPSWKVLTSTLYNSMSSLLDKTRYLGELFKIITESLTECESVDRILRKEFSLEQKPFCATNNNPIRFSMGVSDAMQSMVICPRGFCLCVLRFVRC